MTLKERLEAAARMRANGATPGEGKVVTVLHDGHGSFPSADKSKSDCVDCRKRRKEMLAHMKADVRQQLAAQKNSVAQPPSAVNAVAKPLTRREAWLAKRTARADRRAAAPVQTKPARPSKAVLLMLHGRHEGVTRTCTPEIVQALKADWTVVEASGDARKLAPQHGAVAVLRWDEHGRLFTTQQWRDVCAWAWLNNVAPLSIDFQYFGPHYQGYMADLYDATGASSIGADWPDISAEPIDWSIVDPRTFRWVRERQDLASAAQPITAEKHVAIWTQYGAHLLRPPFYPGDNKRVKEWVNRCIKIVNAAGYLAVVKTSPVARDEDRAGFAGRHVVISDARQNPGVISGAAWHIIGCTSASAELTVCGAPVHACGRSWFNGLGVFAEPETWDDLAKPPSIDAAARNRWARWWLCHQARIDGISQRMIERLDAFRRRQPGHLYTAVHATRPGYDKERPRQGMAFDEVVRLGDEVRTVLDVGCGAGRLVEKLLAAKYDAVGVDIADVKRETKTPDRYLISDARSLQIGTCSYDMVVCNDMLEHLDLVDAQKAILELKRVARKYVLISVGCGPDIEIAGLPQLHVTQQTFDQWQTMIRNSGLTILRAEYRNAVCNLILCAKASAVAGSAA